MRNVDEAEYQLVRHAHHVLGHEPAITTFHHLWAHTAYATLLAPLLFVGLSPTVALKLAAVMIATAGAGTLLAALAWRAGVAAAIVYAIGVIVADAPLTAWSLVYWGAYPEAASLANIGLALLIFAYSGKPRGLVLPGAVLGLAACSSLSVVFVPAAAFAVLLLARRGRDRWASCGAIAVGAIVGFLPWVWWILTKSAGRVFESGLFGASPPLGVMDVVTFPDSISMRYAAKAILSAVESPASRVAAIAGFAATGAVWWSRRSERADGWLVIAPLACVLGFLNVSMFGYAKYLDARHVIWFAWTGPFLVATAAAAGDTLLARARQGLVLVFAVVVAAANAPRLAPFLDMDGIGMASRFRGYDYFRAQFGSVFGDEVDAVNCFLDSRTWPFADVSFRLGFSNLFFPHSTETPFAPRKVEPMSIRSRPPAEPEARDRFFEGFGCAAALHQSATPRHILIALKTPGIDPSVALAAFEECAALPCLPESISRKNRASLPSPGRSP